MLAYLRATAPLARPQVLGTTRMLLNPETRQHMLELGKTVTEHEYETTYTAPARALQTRPVHVLPLSKRPYHSLPRHRSKQTCRSENLSPRLRHSRFRCVCKDMGRREGSVLRSVQMLVGEWRRDNE